MKCIYCEVNVASRGEMCFTCFFKLQEEENEDGDKNENENR